MKTRSLALRISKEKGTVSAKCMVPAEPVCSLVLAHGAGAGMDHPFMVELATLLSEKNIATMRFNFPFMEGGKGRPDSPGVAHQTIEAAIAKAKKIFPGLPLFAGGKSFGGRMSSQALATKPDPDVKGLIFYGFPLHQPGKPSTERAAHLREVKTPMLFLQGTRDELASWELIEPLCKSLKKATLQKIDGANHAFKAGKLNVLQLLADKTSEWVNKKIKQG